MASKPTVRWNESAESIGWPWDRFPDGARRKVERVDEAATQRDLDERDGAPDPGARVTAPPAEGGVLR